MKHLLTPLLFAASLTAAEVSRQATPPQSFIIGLSPFLEKQVKDDVYRAMVRLLVSDLPLNSTLAIYDAYNLKSITRVSLPGARVFGSPKTRANQFAGAVQDLKAFLVSDNPKPAHPHLHFEEAIQVPQFLRFLAQNAASATNAETAVLLIGSPLYQDAKEPFFSMVDGYFPSDGHLLASPEKSVFGFDGETLPFAVHWLYFQDPWVNDLHKEKVTRFWALYFGRRGAQLGTFSSDLPTVLQAFAAGARETHSKFNQWTLDREQTKMEMLRVNRSVDLADWITRETVQTAQRPPSVMVGPMKIGIRWKENLDLDLYTTPRSGAETLFFQHTRSPEGYYYKDHRSSPGREYEFVEYEEPVDVREVEAAVNFYKGHCPGGARGEVRIEFDGRIYGAPFFIEASEGNQGRSGSSQQEYWTKIPVQEILKLKLATAAAR